MTPKKEERKVMTLRPFHLAIPVSDIPKAESFMEQSLVLMKADQMIIGLTTTFLVINWFVILVK